MNNPSKPNNNIRRGVIPNILPYKLRKKAFPKYFMKDVLNWIRKHNIELGIAVNVLSVIISILGFTVAFYLIGETQTQTKAATKSASAAKKSVDLAKNVYDATVKYNDTTLERERLRAVAEIENTISQRKLDEEKAEMDKKIFIAQMNSLKQTQDRFNSENQAFLEIRNLGIDYPSVDAIPLIKLEVFNLGRGTVKIDRMRMSYEYGRIGDSSSVRKSVIRKVKLDKIERQDGYISSSSPLSKVTSWPHVNSIYFNEFREGKGIFYVHLEIAYTNLINNDKRRFTGTFSTRSINDVDFVVHYVNNETIPASKVLPSKNE